MSDVSGLLANKVRPTFTDPDRQKTYTVSYLTQAKKAEFELWLKANAMAVLSEMREILSDEEWRAEMRAYRDDCAAGKFFFHGDLAAAARNTPDGKCALAAVLFGCPFAEMLDLADRYPHEVGVLLDRVIEESMSQQAKDRLAKAKAEAEAAEAEAAAEAASGGPTGEGTLSRSSSSMTPADTEGNAPSPARAAG